MDLWQGLPSRMKHQVLIQLFTKKKLNYYFYNSEFQSPGLKTHVQQSVCLIQHQDLLIKMQKLKILLSIILTC